MTNVKSLHASLLTKTFQFQQKHFFVASTLWGFYLDSGEPILEQTLWPIIAKNIGDNCLFDEAMNKDSCEFLVYGDAISPNSIPTPSLSVSAVLANKGKSLNVYGDRRWQGQGALLNKSSPEPFVNKALSYDNAYGGERHQYNKSGKGANDLSEGSDAEIEETDSHLLPNIEHPNSPINSKHVDEKSAAYIPQGFSAIDSEWPQRKNLLGTFDEEYLQKHMPGLAPDINWSYFYRAPIEQRFNQYLKGDERFCIKNMHRSMAEINGKLPSVIGRCFIEQEVNTDTSSDGNTLSSFKEIPLNLDTVYFFPNSNVGVVVHRGTAEVNHPQAKDVKQLLVAHQGLNEKLKPKEYYQEQLRLRTDPESSYKFMMYSSPLIPEGVRCGFQQLLDKDNIDQFMADNIDTFSQKERALANEKMDELLEKQISELKNNGQQKEAEELLAKLKGTSKDKDELPEDSQKLVELTNKVFPGASNINKDSGLHDIDLTKLNLEAIDELQKHIEKMAHQKKKQATDSIEQQLSVLKEQIKENPKLETELQQTIKQLENIVASRNDIPILTRPAPIEQSGHTAELLEEANKQLLEQKKMAEEGKIKLTEEQLKQIMLVEQQLVNADMQSQIEEVNKLATDSYLKGAHFIPEVRSHQKGKERELVATLLDSCINNQAIVNKDLAFGNIENFTFEQVELNSSFFEYAHLQHVVFNETNLTSINFSHSKLKHVTFNSCLIAGGNLGAAFIEKCVFKNMDLHDITIAHSTLINCEFTNCNFGERMDMLIDTKMNNCKFINCVLTKLNFIELNLTGCQFVNCNLIECNYIKPILNNSLFKESTLNGANFISAQIHSSNFDQATMINTRFVGACELNHSSFSHAKINEANLRDCALNECDFSNADLSKTDFGESSIKNSNFCGSKAKHSQFIDSCLAGSQMERADFMEANLMQADIRGCNFSNSNLYGVSLLNVTLGGTDFSGAILDNTILNEWRPS